MYASINVELKKEVLLLGASGFLGASLISAFSPGRIIGTHYRHPSPGTLHFDIRTTALRELLGRLSDIPDTAVIMLGNTTIDDCAKDPVRTSEINVGGIIRVIEELKSLGIRPVFISSDGVFDGSHPYWRETHAACPIMEYGRQKAAVEAYITSLETPWLIVRLPKLLATRLDDRCIVSGWTRILRSKRKILCATDQFFTPAAVEDVAASIALLVRTQAQGIYHLGGVERLSRRALLGMVTEEFCKYAKVRSEIVECSLKDVPALDFRPLDTSLNSEKFRREYELSYKHPLEIVSCVVADYFADQKAI